MFNVVKLLRNKSLRELRINVCDEMKNMTEDWDKVSQFAMNGQNRKFVKHLLSRICSYVDSLVGKDIPYALYQCPNGKQFEIEHIWADKYIKHKDQFEQESDFQFWRNSIGALLLLPQGTNQSFSDAPYDQKLKHYIKENTFAQTLHPQFYDKNPNFLNSPIVRRLGFTPHEKFDSENIEEREKLVTRICKRIWSLTNFSAPEIESAGAK